MVFVSTLPLLESGDVAHSSAFLASIRDGIAASVSVGNYASTVFWVRKLNIYLTLKYDISPIDRAQFSQLLVPLCVLPKDQTDTVHGSVIASTAVRLLKKKEVEMKFDLEWRPIWEAIKAVLFPRGRDRVFFADAGYAGELLKLVREARRFFPPSATLEIFEEFLPDMNPHNLHHMQRISDVFTRFLPSTTIPTPPRNFAVTAPNAPAFFWVPTIFSLWSLVSGSSELDLAYISVLARLAEDQVANPRDCGWTHAMIDTIFAVGLRDLELPVGSGDIPNRGRTSGGSSKSKISPYFSRFVANTIYPTDDPADAAGYAPPSNTLPNLLALLQATETYFHPSNLGVWSSKLASLIHSLSHEVLKRWRKEQKADCATPTAIRLTKGTVSAFVEAVNGVAMLALFSKDPRAVSDANGAIKCCAWLESVIVLPKVLERVLPALENLTETHRTQACLSNLGLTIVPIVNRQLYPDGARSFVELLNLSLPGIDMNDPSKTVSTFAFLSSALMVVPVADVSLGGGRDESDADADVRLSTAAFEDWVVQFLGRIFTLFENLPQIHGASNQNTMENVVVNMAVYALQVLFQQCEAHIHEGAVAHLARWIDGNGIPAATKSLGKFVSVAGGGNPAVKLRAFLKTAVTRVREEIEGGAGTRPSLPGNGGLPFSFASSGDARLHWYQSVLLNTVHGSGEALLAFKGPVESGVEEMVQRLRSYRGVKWAGKAIEAVVGALAGVYPREFRSFEKSVWEDSAAMAESYKRWGEFGDAKNFTVDWHVPNDDEVDWAVSMLRKYGKMCMDRLTELMKDSEATMDGASDVKRDQSFEFSRWALLLRGVAGGVSSLMAPWDDISSRVKGAKDHTAYPECGYLPKGHRYHTEMARLRLDLGEVLERLVNHFQKFREDDIQPLKQIIKTLVKFVSFRGVKAGQLANLINGYKYIKSTVATVEGDKKLPRFLLVKRSQILHLHRRRFAFSHCTPHTVQSEALMTRLFELSISRYAEIRTLAQSSLIQCMVPFENLKRTFYKSYIDTLVSKDSKEYQVKACLHVCNSAVVQDLARSDFQCAALFAKAICQSFGDKPSIQELVRKVFMNYLHNASQLSISYPVSSPLVQLVGKFWAPNAPAMEEAGNEVVDKKAINTQLYQTFITDMIAVIKDPATHWRAQAMAINLLETIWRPQDRQPIELTTVIMEGVMSSLPTFRDVCSGMLLRILRGLKARAKAAGANADRTVGFRKEIVRSEGNVVDTENYLSLSVSTSAEAIHDSSIVGWYCWPQKSKFYSQPDASFDLGTSGLAALPFADPASLDSVDAILHIVSTNSFWIKFIRYHSQESSKGVERFNSECFNLVRALAGQYEDLFLGHLEPLVKDLVSDPKEKSKQRAAAEILAGVVRGSKNWSTVKIEKMWAWALPIVSSAMQASTTETTGFWIEFVNSISANRDPRRVLPLIQFVFSWKIDSSSQSFFAESKKLSFTKVLIAQFKWRLFPLLLPLLTDLLGHVRHPYQQVRDLLGVLLNDATTLMWHPAANSVAEALAWNIRSQGGLHSEVYKNVDFKGVVPAQPHPAVKDAIESLYADMQEWRQMIRTTNVGPSDYGNASKTVLAWMVASYTSPSNTAKYTMLRFQVPEIFKMLEFEDSDLQTSAGAMAIVHAYGAFPLPIATDVLTQVIDILAAEPKWQVKVKLIPLIQILFFRNLPLLTAAVKSRVLDMVTILLEDTQVEVRTLAGVTLSGLIRCSERDSISALKAKFEAILKATKAAKKKTTLPPRPDLSPAAASRPHPLLLKRHASVIGLSSLVLAFPYEVPNWLPGILITLSYCVSDMAPIGATVSKTFSDFRRTHQDTWKNEGMHAFTEEQLSILSDLLISSSYYA
ncbi:hypothetical protein BC830DRAFT_1117031 [Chytriomyces sp. MP71]|nr:hypothetical protein BC830DRAFT_1117031 [Chytriomyces sp. MP71]